LVVEETVTKLTEGKGDAYQFDCKMYRKGKKNTVRLEIFRSGDMLSIFARGYLGKGVMKAIINPDSILVYFPTSNEYYSGKLEDLIGGKCAGSMIYEEVLIKLFMMTPPELEKSYEGFYVNVVKQNKKRQEFQLNSKVCEESIELGYRLYGRRFILDDIEYENEVGTFKFIASNRKARLDIDIPESKLDLKIPENSIRIIK